jgi:carbon-monoxide dehydrogenase small subunit
MVMISKALLDRDPDPTADEIARALSGNICRCTGYRPIVQAVEVAAEAMRGERGADR